MTQQAATTALVIEVPEAEPVVGRHRARLDPFAAGGVPAHVTVLFPFVEIPRLVKDPLLADDVAQRVARVVSGQPAFPYCFSRTRWFGDRVLWLAPDDPSPFVALTRALALAFPGFEPYEGMFDDIVPHLTIGQREDPAPLREAEEDTCGRLPVRGHATDVSLLLLDSSGGWERLWTAPLGARAGRPCTHRPNGFLSVRH